ncbi:hypothetical protein OIU77_022986 [Salix suchowensis]|uniref:Peptidase M1 alanyl aminopeptidase C-terminal domain-containing protein n=1 Tax=Salix suchowensis TaxID=1278906 RepID=A0ABQ9C4B7_9ROSI|nr:hypothetical protein OIU78_009851 [Salix suchowensis]KAJ6393660.1 hypothetical protein OIU77_022986 [Salix suchowensis]
MTDQFAALAAIAQNPGKSRDEVLVDFYTKWQDDYLVNLLLSAIYFSCFFLSFSTKGQIYLENNDFHEAIMSLEAIARDKRWSNFVISCWIICSLFLLGCE